MQNAMLIPAQRIERQTVSKVLRNVNDGNLINVKSSPRTPKLVAKYDAIRDENTQGTSAA